MIINTVVISNDFLVSSGWDGKVNLWDIATKSQISSFKADSYINLAAWCDSKAKTVYVGGKSGYLALLQM